MGGNITRVLKDETTTKLNGCDVRFAEDEENKDVIPSS